MSIEHGIEALRGDDTLQDALGEVYAGDGLTYADKLAAVEDWQGAYTMLVEACAIARTSGNYCAADSIREAVGRFHVELAAGRTCALYARQLERWIEHATS